MSVKEPFQSKGWYRSTISVKDIKFCHSKIVLFLSWRVPTQTGKLPFDKLSKKLIEIYNFSVRALCRLSPLYHCAHGHIHPDFPLADLVQKIIQIHNFRKGPYINFHLRILSSFWVIMFADTYTGRKVYTNNFGVKAIYQIPFL